MLRLMGPLMLPSTPTREEGDKCRFPDCDGKYEIKPVENCSCHISPPCPGHSETVLVCSECRDDRPDAEVPAPKHDPVNHPKHYTSHPSGIECIQVTEHFGFNVGNAIKYLWRAEEKGAPLQDLQKAAWYVNREIEKREKATPKPRPEAP